LCGDWDPCPQLTALGIHQLTVTAYDSAGNAGTPISLGFFVVDSSLAPPSPAPSMAPTPQPTPMPTPTPMPSPNPTPSPSAQISFLSGRQESLAGACSAVVIGQSAPLSGVL